jgi:hypothetical protein
MNRAAAAVVALLAVLAVVVGVVMASAQVREWVLEDRCIRAGGVPLWHPSSPSDTRPDGYLPFTCAPHDTTTGA